MFKINNKAAARQNKVGRWVFMIEIKAKARKHMVGRATPRFRSAACKGPAI